MTLGEFRNFTKDIDDDAEIYFDTTELPLWYLGHRKRTGLPDLVILHGKHSYRSSGRSKECMPLSWKGCCVSIFGRSRTDEKRN